MLMEEEVPGLLKMGFGSVIAIALVFMVVLWIKRRSGGYGWLVAHLLFVSWALVGGFEVLDTRGDENASSAENSLKLAWSGFIWLIGMICFLVGTMLLHPRNNKND